MYRYSDGISWGYEVRKVCFITCTYRDALSTKHKIQKYFFILFWLHFINLLIIWEANWHRHMDTKRLETKNTLKQWQVVYINVPDLFLFLFVYVKFCILILFLFPLSSGWGLSMVHTSLYIFWPITHIFIGVEYEVGWTRHMVLPFPFTHVVHCAVCLVWVVWNVSIFLFTNHWISCNMS